MNPRSKILAMMPLKKGDAYGAVPTGKRCGRATSNRSRSGLNHKSAITQTGPGRAPQRAPGVLKHPSEEPKVWRCFHCDEVFTDPKEAATHFGTVQVAQAICTIRADEIRHMEWCLARYRDEDSDLQRQIASLKTQHQMELRRAEEAGYARGLRDAKAL